MATVSSSATMLNTIQISFLFIIFLATACRGGNILYSGEKLCSEGSLQLGSATFKMQEDCNLVLYDNGRAIWATGTHGKDRNCYCIMQDDGNFVLYTPNSVAIWASDTARDKGNYVLILQKDRNVVVYGPAMWATGTYQLGSGVTTVANVIGQDLNSSALIDATGVKDA